MKKILLCGATGFIGKNLLRHFAGLSEYEVYATHHERPGEEIPQAAHPIHWVPCDLRKPEDVERAVTGKDIVIQAAATTSGSKDIVTRPYYHVTDNAVMNSLLFRACHKHEITHVIFFSCTTMYAPGENPVREEDFDGHIIDRYFGVGWTKVYIEKMCEFYAKISSTKYTAIRHSNIYGPFDKYDLEKSHVFGATVAKVMAACDGKVVVWGDGSDERDLLHVDDLVDFVQIALKRQASPFELVNLGLGQSVSVKTLVGKIIEHSGRDLKMEFDLTKPTIGFKLGINIDRARKVFQWEPKTGLDEGIKKTLEWYHRFNASTQKASS